MRATLLGPVAGLAMLVVAGCSDDRPPSAAETPTQAATSAPTTSAPPATPTAEPAPDPAGGPPVLSRWFDTRRDGGDLRLGAVRERTASYTSYDVTFASQGRRISGVLNVPRGPGPFPAVVLAHGYIDPTVYVRGQGMTRERGYLADHGYVALHVDYRNHAESGDDSRLVQTFRFGYAVDVLNAVTSLRDSPRVPLADDRVALMGRSMGGGVVMQALEMAPGFVQAGVLFASVSSEEADNYRQFGDGGSGFWGDVGRRFGTPAASPAVWRAASTATYADRITEPVLMIHGTADDTCPPAWASATRARLAAAGVDVRLRYYPGEGHAFGPQFDRSMAQIVRYLDRRTG